MACSLQFKIGALNLSRQSMLGQIGYDSTHTHAHTKSHFQSLRTYSEHIIGNLEHTVA